MTRRRRFALLPALACAALACIALPGCSTADEDADGKEGRPLSQIDLSGPPPHQLILLGPDEVRLRQGERLAIAVDGDRQVAASLRFTLKDGALGILRQDDSWDLPGKAIIDVTMPAPDKLVAAGSGTIRAESLAPRAAITIAGSGDVETLNVVVDALDVTIAGSGNYRAAGTSAALNLIIAGSGHAGMEALSTQRATVEIAGSGNGTFASDGEVTARIAGSGLVQVSGKARCSATSSGSGKLVCQP